MPYGPELGGLVTSRDRPSLCVCCALGLSDYPQRVTIVGLVRLDSRPPGCRKNEQKQESNLKSERLLFPL
jgi:hypothetical protein